MKKLFLILICAALVGCASKPAELAEVAPVVSEPVVTNLKIIIEFSAPDMASVTVSYSADNWAFINGVELQNGAGDKMRYTFKTPYRKVMSNGSILEICTITLQNYVIDGIASTGASKLRDFVAVGDVTARPLADNEFFNFSAVVINELQDF